MFQPEPPLLPGRRQLLAMLGACAVTGCAHDSTYDLVRAAFFDSHGDSNRYPMTPDQIADLPYATLGVRVGNNPAAVLVLAEIQQDQLLWVSSNRAIFVTQGARLVKTIGLQPDLSMLTAVGTDPLLLQSPFVMPAGTQRIEQILDLREPDEYGIPVHAELTPVGEELIEIVGRPRATVHLRETVSVPRWQWRTTNDYWLDAKSGALWRSVVRYSPAVPVLRLEVLKPAAR